MFYVVKAADGIQQESSPKTQLQRAVGFVCNLFRRLNIVSPAAPVVLVLAVIVMAVKAVAAPLAGLLRLGRAGIEAAADASRAAPLPRRAHLSPRRVNAAGLRPTKR